MLESTVNLNRDIGGSVSNDGVDVAQQNIKNKLASSPELTSSAEELNAAQNAWESVHTVEPSLASLAGTGSTNTLEKKHLHTPSPPSTPSLIYSNNTSAPVVPAPNTTTSSTAKSRPPSNELSSPSHPSLLQQHYGDQLSEQSHHQPVRDHGHESWSPHHRQYQPPYQYPHPPSFRSNYSLQHYPLQMQSYTKTNGSLSSLIPASKVTPDIDFDETWEYFTRQDMSHVKGSIRPHLERRGVPGLLRGLFGPRKLKPELVQERDLLFCIAQCPLSNNEPLHLQMLRTIYKRLTGTRADCQRYGPHWDIIGFQGSDPATDLRGVGLLGLVQMVALVCGEQTQLLAADVFALSHDQHSQFPLMVLCLNVTRIALQALREGCLNKECNSRGNVRHVLNEYFAAVLFYIFYIWRKERKSITDSGYLIKDAEAYCKANVRTVLQRLQQYLRHDASISNPDLC